MNSLAHSSPEGGASIPGELEAIARAQSHALVAESGGQVRFLDAYTNMMGWLAAMREQR